MANCGLHEQECISVLVHGHVICTVGLREAHKTLILPMMLVVADIARGHRAGLYPPIITHISLYILICPS